jgi:hypothetical protein
METKRTRQKSWHDTSILGDAWRVLVSRIYLLHIQYKNIFEQIP